MDLLLERDLQLLLADHGGPCVSLFLPTPGTGPDAAAAARERFREILRRVEEELAGAGVEPEAARAVVRPGWWLLRDTAFWRHLSGGLAAFLCADFCRVFRLPIAFSERVVTGEHFFIKPLLPVLSGTGRFYLLGLGSVEIQLWECSERALRRLTRAELPRGLAQALDDPAWSGLAAAAGSLPRPGWDGRYARLAQLLAQVDAGVRDLLRSQRAPLVLAADEALLPLYREINGYPHLVRRGIARDPDGMTEADLHERAWRLVHPSFVADQQHAAHRLSDLLGTSRASNDIAEVLPAARRGRIEVLFLAGDAELWGRFDGDHQRVALHPAARPGDEDLLDAAAAFTLKNGGTAYAVSAGEVPGGGAIAASFRP
jgi:hypothetical protein